MKAWNIELTASGLIFAERSELMLYLSCTRDFMLYQSSESLLLSCWRTLHSMLLCLIMGPRPYD
jgi:hypothetical protein